MNKITTLIKMIIPPIIVSTYRACNNNRWFTGNYPSWDAALQDCTGYETDSILNKVKESLLKIKDGRAIYERDSILFNKIQFSFPLLCGLLRVAVENNGNLNVLDFGGSLGSSYYQNKEFLSGVKNLRWSIVEQEKFVKVGKEFFEDDILHFYFTIEECLANEKTDVIILSSVIQYIERPHELLSEIVSKKVKYIIIDRTPFFENHPDQLTVQKVPAEIYNASYPAWFFNEQIFLKSFEDCYSLIVNVDSFESWSIDKIKVQNKCLIFKLQEKLK